MGRNSPSRQLQPRRRASLTEPPDSTHRPALLRDLAMALLRKRPGDCVSRNAALGFVCCGNQSARTRPHTHTHAHTHTHTHRQHIRYRRGDLRRSGPEPYAAFGCRNAMADSRRGALSGKGMSDLTGHSVRDWGIRRASSACSLVDLNRSDSPEPHGVVDFAPNDRPRPARKTPARAVPPPNRRPIVGHPGHLAN